MANSKPKGYVNNWLGVLAAAKDAGAKFPELVAAQWALESGFGQHTSGQFNYFGLKGEGTTRTTTEYVNGKPVQIEAAFLDFADLGECVRYLVTRWYKDWDQYEGVNRAATRDAAAKELVKQGLRHRPALRGEADQAHGRASAAGGRRAGGGQGQSEAAAVRAGGDAGHLAEEESEAGHRARGQGEGRGGEGQALRGMRI